MPAFVSSPVPSHGTAAPSAPPEDGGWMGMVLLMVGSCLPVFGAMLVTPVLPRMQEWFAGVPDAGVLVPLTLTLPALGLAVTAPLAGMIIDWLGRKVVLVVMSILYAVFGTVPLWLDSLRAVVVSRALLGVTMGFIITCCTTLIGDYYTGRTRNRRLALQTVCTTTAATVSFLLGGALGSQNWRTPFWLYTVGLLLAPAMAVFLPRPRPDATAENPPAVGARPFPQLRLAGICLLTLFGAVVFYAVPLKTPDLLESRGLESSALIGMVTALVSAATVTGSVICASLAGRPERRMPAIFGLCGAGFVLMALAQGPLFLVLGAALNCVGTGLLLPSLLTWAMSPLRYSHRGQGTGWWIASFCLGQYLCLLALNTGQAKTGSLAHAVGLLGLAACLVAAGLVPLLLRRPRTA